MDIQVRTRRNINNGRLEAPYIDGQATTKKLSRSAFVAALLANIRLVESPAGQQALAKSLQSVMAEGALRAGQPVEVVRKLFPDFDGPLLLDEPAPPTPQLPAGETPSPPSAPEVVAVSRRRPYRRARTRVASIRP